MNVLKCPFCGADGETKIPKKYKWEKVASGIYGSLCENSEFFIAQCSNTKCVGHSNRRFKTIEESVAAWNRRDGANEKT